MDKIEAKPFVKWAGGKRQLLDALLRNIPESFNDYYEPFVGGGALYFKLWSLSKIKKAYLSDSNMELINAYLVIQKNVSVLITELKKSKYKNDSESFYRIRSEKPTDAVKKAARFIYLNKTAFNGLYRVNSKGEFNVPFGKYKNPAILDEKNLRAVNKALKNAKIICADFQDAIKSADKNDVIYLDPPYHPLNGTSNFTQYTPDNFSLEDQKRLRDVFAELGKKGACVILSNSDTAAVKELYSGYPTLEVYASRAINCKADRRGKISELLIKSWYNGGVF